MISNVIQQSEAQIDELIIGVAAKLQQKTFETGKHDRAWCEEAEEQHRMFLRYIQFEKKKSLYEKFCEDLKKADWKIIYVMRVIIKIIIF